MKCGLSLGTGITDSSSPPATVEIATSGVPCSPCNSFNIVNAGAPEDRLTDQFPAVDPPLYAVVLSFAGINFIDWQESDADGKVIDNAPSRDVEVGLSRVKARVRSVWERDGVVERLGPDHLHATTDEAVADLIQDDDDTP